MLRLTMLLLIASAVSMVTSSPYIRGRSQSKSAPPGSSVKFVCSVGDQDNHTVRWWFDNHHLQISSNADILTDDAQKYSVRQPIAGESSGIWVLEIRNVSAMDAGHYVCDISQSDQSMTSDLQITGSFALTRPESIPHVNFTRCCMENRVGQECLPICSPATFEPLTFHMRQCDRYMPQLLKCGSDGSNHIPCCRRRYIPDQCLDYCMGKLPDVIEPRHRICIHSATDIIACFEEGTLLLPGPPEGLLVRATSPTKLYLKWRKPVKNGESVIGYYAFYQRQGTANYQSTAFIADLAHRLNYLDPGTAYNLYVVAVNEHGSSLPSYIIHINTPPARSRPRFPTHPLQDPVYILQCCRRYAVSEDCLDVLCSNTGPRADLHLRRCLPQFAKVVPCFLRERNHTDCCIRREVPEVCLPLCSGNVTEMRFQFLSCRRHMREMSMCLVEGVATIPGPPMDVHAVRVTSNEADIDWDPPMYGDAPVTSYLVQFKERYASDYLQIPTTETRVTLANLLSNTQYAVMVSSLGVNGSSLPSPALIFLTYPPPGSVSSTESPPSTTLHNVTSCCQTFNVRDDCMRLCNYDADFSTIGPDIMDRCSSDLHVILECAVDGRNHSWCCRQRGVAGQCIKFCEFSRHSVEGYQLTDEDVVCVFEMRNLAMCMKEGIARLPSRPTQLRVANTTVNTISLKWQPPAHQANGVTGYVLEYRVYVQPPGLWQSLRTPERHIIIQNLPPATAYRIRVSAYNDEGASLPSSSYVVRTLDDKIGGRTLNFSAPINISACCREKHVKPDCMPACDNSAPVPRQCHMELPQLVTCSADGRDHSDCCTRRGVPPTCLVFCKGVPHHSEFASFMCMGSLPRILSCFREGLPVLPSPPLQFHVVGVSSRWLQFAWSKPLKNGDNVHYSLQYEDSTGRKTIDNITTVTYRLDDLQPVHRYPVSVVAVNRYGISVPSAMAIAWTLQDSIFMLLIHQTPPGYIPEHIASVTLTCHAIGDNVDLYWLRNGVAHNDSTFSLQGVTRSDMGRYTCIGRNNAGLQNSFDYYVKVQFHPVVNANMTRINRSPGQTVLSCAFSGYPETISWSRSNGNMTYDTNRYIITRLINESIGVVESRLTIMLPVPSHYDTYSCLAENDFGSTNVVLVFSDESGPPFEPYHPTTAYASLAECCEARGVSFKCQVACSFDVDVDALRAIVPNPLDCLSDIAAIVECGADGRDHSQCCRNNSVPDECLAVCAGNVQALTEYHIPCFAHFMAISDCMEEGHENIPSPPQNVRALLSHGYIKVTWDSPAKNSDKVTFYEVNYRRAAVGTTLQVKISPPSREVLLTSVYSHTEYHINVSAGNHHGDSIPSRTIVITTLESMPSAPHNFTGHVIDSSSMQLSWTKPENNSVVVRGYLITYDVWEPYHRHTKNISNVLTYKLKDLTPHTTYKIFVRAESSHFISPRSRVVTMTTLHSVRYFGQHFGDATSVGLFIGLTFAIMMVVLVIGLALFRHFRNKAQSEHLCMDSVAFENPNYSSSLAPKISGLPGGPTSSIDGSTEFDDSSTMRETESDSIDLGYETLSTGPKKDDNTVATLHTED